MVNLPCVELWVPTPLDVSFTFRRIAMIANPRSMSRLAPLMEKDNSSTRNGARLIQALDIWPQPPRVTAISQGYTNQNYRIEVGGESYFGRVADDLPRHGISRRDEAVSLQRAAREGIAPEVVYASAGVIVTRAINGRPLPASRPRQATLRRIGKLLARVHRLAPHGDRSFDPIEMCRSYLEQLRYDTLAAAHRQRFEEILSAAPELETDRLIHGDAFHENFIDDGKRLWLIDWEYAGKGDPAVDLAFIAMNLNLDRPQQKFLLAAHGGGIPFEKFQSLLPVAALRDVLWCLVELGHERESDRLVNYSTRCFQRLGLG